MFRPAHADETPALVALGVATGIFQPGEAEALLGGVLEEIHAGRMGEDHLARVWASGPGGTPEGWVYFAPMAFADRVWNLWWIGVAPDRQGRGIGGELLGAVEAHVRGAGGRVLLIETSSLPKFDPVRRFYANRGYSECGRVPDFYADGEAKVIFVKKMMVRDGGPG